MSGYCRVLMLDDEFIMRQGMKHMLDWEKEGFRIVGEGATGEEGLTLVEELKPHIVLADIVMPVMDGIEFSAILGKKHPEIQIIILSSYDKFDYVKATLLNGASDYILKPMLNPENLLDTLKKAAGRIPGFELTQKNGSSVSGQIERYLMGFTDRLDEAVFARIFPNTLYRLLGVSLKECCRGHREDYFAVRRRVEEFFKERLQYSMVSVFLQEEILCIVLNYRMKDSERLIRDVGEIAEKVRRIHSSAFFVLGREFASLQNIRRSYQEEILQETGRGFYYPEKDFLMVEIMNDEEKPKRFEFEIYTGYLSAKEYEKALSLFEDYIAYLCDRKIESEKLKNLSRNLLYNYLMETDRLTGQTEELRDRFFRQIEEARRVDHFREVMTGIFAQLAELLEKSGGVQDVRIREIKKYVADHYAEPLELSVIAEQFNLSYSYLSTYFSQTAKEGFSEYLNKIRIRHAQELLEDQSLPVARIGEMVGYTEHSYFCRVFKRITQETPSGYRKRVKRG